MITRQKSKPPKQHKTLSGKVKKNPSKLHATLWKEKKKKKNIVEV